MSIGRGFILFMVGACAAVASTGSVADDNELILKCRYDVYEGKQNKGKMNQYFKLARKGQASQSDIFRYANGEWYRTSSDSEANEKRILIYSGRDARYYINRLTGSFSGNYYDWKLRGSCERAEADPAKRKPKF